MLPALQRYFARCGTAYRKRATGQVPRLAPARSRIRVERARRSGDVVRHAEDVERRPIVDDSVRSSRYARREVRRSSPALGRRAERWLRAADVPEAKGPADLAASRASCSRCELCSGA